MSDFAHIQHECTTASQVMERARETLKRRKSLMARVIKPTPVLDENEPESFEPTTYPVKEIQMAVCRA